MFDKNFVDNQSYLKVKKKDVKEFSEKKLKKNSLNIGIVWKSSKDSDYNSERILSLDSFNQLFSLKNIKLYSLQKDELEELDNYPKIKDLGSKFKNFYDTAVAISALDYVISIDTSVAHLVGALGKKGCVLHSDKIIDFRWDKVSGQSTWYNSLEIIKYHKVEEIMDNLVEKIKNLK
jgi:ADP-heptose:LPS heptosyltransferase